VRNIKDGIQSEADIFRDCACHQTLNKKEEKKEDISNGTIQCMHGGQSGAYLKCITNHSMVFYNMGTAFDRSGKYKKSE